MMELQLLYPYYVGINGTSVVATPTITTTQVDRKDALPALYKAIGCNLVDAVELVLCGKPVTLWVNDEGLFQPHEIASEEIGHSVTMGWVIKDDRGIEVRLAGNIVFSGIDEKGNTVESPLTGSEIESLLQKQIDLIYFKTVQ